MSNPPKQQQRSRMVAAEDDPWISVSLLAEHTFCPRAGIIQHESQEEDTGEEQFHSGRGRVRTYYALEEIQKDLSMWRKRTLWAVGALFGSVVFYGLGAILVRLSLGPSPSQRPPYAAQLSACSSTCCCLVPVSLLLSVICGFLWLNVYLSHYRPAVRAIASIPDPNHTSSQPVNWWALLNAGFESRRLSEALRYPRWRLVGCPWRILVKGDLRIPVFRKRPSRGTTGERLYRQHYARMAAYCHLIETCEGAKSPYGIIMYGHSHDGITVPNKPGTRKTFHDSLLATRETISALGRVDPPSPDNLNKCSACPHSWRDRDTGQSVCGERFTWRPPNIRDEWDR